MVYYAARQEIGAEIVWPATNGEEGGDFYLLSTTSYCMALILSFQIFLMLTGHEGRGGVDDGGPREAVGQVRLRHPEADPQGQQEGLRREGVGD